MTVLCVMGTLTARVDDELSAAVSGIEVGGLALVAIAVLHTSMGVRRWREQRRACAVYVWMGAIGLLYYGALCFVWRHIDSLLRLSAEELWVVPIIVGAPLLATWGPMLMAPDCYLRPLGGGRIEPAVLWGIRLICAVIVVVIAGLFYWAAARI